MFFAIAPIFAVVLVLLPFNALAAPIPDDGSSYSGVGGNASGGGVTTSSSPSTGGLSALGLGDGSSDDGLNSLMGGGPLLSAWSDNAGSGGSALSGTANAGNGGAGSAAGTEMGTNSDNAYTGAGGHSAGGSVTENAPPGLVQLFSDNAGNGGAANSGTSESGSPNNS
ncbi:hypothetical protein FRB96_002262 [Tulasnella sp. 330]|nr:hypothetical protein FRB96_002262 [Tulasnella sp. 330]KAG8883708.1 hypothetical protein FRB97_006019 [Tulasnella sp. 331]KAG8889059.1 hypothetical protein FRB98_005956 [Tulasnella sp. 332]